MHLPEQALKSKSFGVIEQIGLKKCNNKQDEIIWIDHIKHKSCRISASKMIVHHAQSLQIIMAQPFKADSGLEMLPIPVVHQKVLKVEEKRLYTKRY